MHFRQLFLSKTYFKACFELVVNEISNGLQCLELQDENGAFLETTTPESLKASIPAKVHEAYS